MTIYSLNILLSQFSMSPFFHIILQLLLLDHLRRQVRWSCIPVSLRIFHSLLWSTQSKALTLSVKKNRFFYLEFPCFFYDPMNVGNLISCSSAFSKSSLYIWKLSIQILLKPSLKDFEHDLSSMWNELCGSLNILWHCPFWIGMKTELLQSCGHC